MTKVRRTGRAISIPAGVLLGMLCAMAVTVAGCLITAKLLDGELLAQENMGYAIMVFLPASAWAGAQLAVSRTMRRKALVCLLSGIGLYCTLIALTAMFFGGQYSGAGETGLLIFCGSMLPVFSGKQGRNTRKSRKRKNVYR